MGKFVNATEAYKNTIKELVRIMGKGADNPKLRLKLAKALEEFDRTEKHSVTVLDMSNGTDLPSWKDSFWSNVMFKELTCTIKFGAATGGIFLQFDISFALLPGGRNGVTTTLISTDSGKNWRIQ